MLKEEKGNSPKAFPSPIYSVRVPNSVVLDTITNEHFMEAELKRIQRTNTEVFRHFYRKGPTMTDLKTCPIESGVTSPEDCKLIVENAFKDMAALRDKLFDVAFQINFFSNGAVGRIEFPIGTEYSTSVLKTEERFSGDVICLFREANERPTMCSVTKCDVKGDARSDGKIVFWYNKE